MESNRVGSVLGALGGFAMLVAVLLFRHLHPIVAIGLALGAGIVIFGLGLGLQRITRPAVAALTTCAFAVATAGISFVRLAPRVNEKEIVDKLISQAMLAELGQDPANLDLSYHRYGRCLPAVERVQTVALEMCEEAKAYRHQQGFFLHPADPDRWLADKDRAATLDALQTLGKSLDHLRVLEDRLVGKALAADLENMNLPSTFRASLSEAIAKQSHFVSQRAWMENEGKIIVLLTRIYRRLTPKEVVFTPPRTIAFRNASTLAAHRADLDAIGVLSVESQRLREATRILVTQ